MLNAAVVQSGFVFRIVASGHNSVGAEFVHRSTISSVMPFLPTCVPRGAVVSPQMRV